MLKFSSSYILVSSSSPTQKTPRKTSAGFPTGVENMGALNGGVLESIHGGSIGGLKTASLKSI